MAGTSWREREAALGEAYVAVAERHNRLGITDPLPAELSRYYGRPFRVIHAGRFVSAIRATIRDEAVLALPAHVGSVDQFVDSTDVLTSAALRARLREIWLT